MKKKNTTGKASPAPPSLRTRAEQRLSAVRREKAGKLPQEEIRKLVHELETHRIELEIQNEDLRSTQEDLEHSRRRYSSLFNFAPVGYITLNHALQVQEANFTAAAMLGIELRDLYGMHFLQMVVLRDHGVFLRHVNDVMGSARRGSCEVRLRKKDGSEFIASLQSVSEEDGGRDLVRTAVIDITDRKKSEQAVQRQAELLNLTRDTIVVRSMDDRILFWNRGAEETFGWNSNEAVGRSAPILLKTKLPDDSNEINRQLLRTGAWNGEVIYRRRDDSEIIVSSRWALQRDETGRPVAVMEINSDITERKMMEETIRFQAFHDALTSLPNRRLFMDHLSREISHAKRNRELLAVMFLDLDRFKVINDTLGHIVGDRILQVLADRLKERMRESDVVARIGGDEFGVVVSSLVRPEDMSLIAEKILTGFDEPVLLDDREFDLSGSMGISIFPQDGDHPDVLLRNADIAMYQAKARGRKGFAFFDPEMNAKSLERLIIENSFRQMLGKGQLTVHYQPQIDAGTGEIVGAEALARWRHPELGLLNPVEFIPLAEETGLIEAIDEWVLRAACGQRKEWQRSAPDTMTVSVNLSAGNFHRAGLAEKISRILAESGLDARLLQIEITESVAIQDNGMTSRNLKDLTAMGVTLAIDDFGIGYSSLSSLKKLPISSLKIDKSFVAGFPGDEDSKAIVKAIVAMAHSMKLVVVAEGVETEEQCSELTALRCDQIQGYLIKRAVPSEELEKMLEAA